MSCMLLGHAHVNGLLNFARANYRNTDSRVFKMPAKVGGKVYGSKLGETQYPTDAELSQIGRMLIAANLRDHHETYQGRYAEDRAEYDPKRYKYFVDVHAQAREIGWVSKQIDCLRYNADIKPDSEEGAFLDWVLSLAIEILPTYKAAPWGYDGPESNSEAA